MNRRLAPALLAGLLLCGPADARDSAPSRQAVAQMSAAELRAIAREQKQIVEDIRKSLLAAALQPDIARLARNIEPPRDYLNTVIGGISDRQKSGSDDELDEIKDDLNDTRSCLNDIRSGVRGDFSDLEELFGERYGKGKTLKNWIEDDTSGNYRKLLLKACGY